MEQIVTNQVVTKSENNMFVNLNIDQLINYFKSEFQTSSEPYIVKSFEYVMGIASDGKIYNKALELCDLLVQKINPYCFDMIAPVIYSGMKSIKWQIKMFALTTISKFAQYHPLIVAQNMPDIIVNLIGLSIDPKKEVKNLTTETFSTVCSTIENVDIKHLIPVIISAYMNPAIETQKALDALISTPFVNDVDIPTLGFLVPLLVKSMKERKMVYQRRAAVVIETLCKLLKNPAYAKVFYPILEPILTKGYDEIAELEIRNVCLNSKNVLNAVYSLGVNESLDNYTLEKCRDTFKNFIDEDHYLLEYSVQLVYSLVRHEIRTDSIWLSCMHPYLQYVVEDCETRSSIINQIKDIIISSITINEYNPEDDEENLCDCVFSLAYGTRVLLHQTPFKVKVGRKYGLVGPNGAGKSTLMKAIANKNLQEFPEELSCIYVEHDIQGNKSELSVLDYVAQDEKVIAMGATNDQIIVGLSEVGFLDNMIKGPVTALSGGWRMKLALSRAMLLNPDMLLLDEPTNHLDEFAVKWLVNYINGLTKTTCLIVSHDTKFLDLVCTNITHYEGLKLKFYRGNLSEFVKQKPEATQYYSLTSDVMSFNFPDPGYLEGVKSLTKAVLKMKDCSFQYPTAPKPQLVDVSIQVSLASRVSIVGVNGAGKSTLVKLIVGELEADKGLIERHPNVRVAYVAQHAFHHIEDHLDKSPIEYVMWRYRGGYDKESVGNDAYTMTPEELEAIKKRAKENKEMIINELVSRRTGKREHEYEAKNDQLEIVQWFTKNELIQMGYEKMVKEKDLQIAMESTMGQRKLTTGEIQKHFDNFGLEPDFSQHAKLSMLSGGQKMRCTLAACTWNLPHIIILDEPTNFLDRDSLIGLINAIKCFKGGILVISHNSEFYENICADKPEKWLLESGYLTTMGGEWMDEVEKARKKAEKENSKKLTFDQAEDKFDAAGNKVEVVKEKKELSRADKKALLKQKKDMEKRGEDTYEIDQLLGLE